MGRRELLPPLALGLHQARGGDLGRAGHAGRIAASTLLAGAGALQGFFLAHDARTGHPGDLDGLGQLRPILGHDLPSLPVGAVRQQGGKDLPRRGLGVRFSETKA